MNLLSINGLQYYTSESIVNLTVLIFTTLILNTQWEFYITRKIMRLNTKHTESG